MQHLTECHVERLPAKASRTTLVSAPNRLFAIAGMGCSNCANRVRNSILGVDGVFEVEVEVETGLARVWRDPDTPDGADSSDFADTVIQAVAAAGRDTHHRYLAVPLRSRFGQADRD